MSKNEYSLDYIIEKSFEESIEYFNKNGIKVEGLKLIILESPEPLIQKYGEYKINKNINGIYDSGTIYIIKSTTKDFIDSVLIDLNYISNTNLFAISRNGVLWPVYKNNDNVEEIIMKSIAKQLLDHEIGHHMLGDGEWKASVVEFLAYFYENELYKYPEVYEIIEKNIEICERHIKKANSTSYSSRSPLVPYFFGLCFANDIIYVYEKIFNKDNSSPKLNIRDMIEKLKLFSEDDYVKITERYNMVVSNYIALSRALNAQYATLSWITNCLFEKPPNMTNNI